MTKNLKKFLAILLAMSMTLGMLTIGASAAEDRTYADVFDGDWYEDAVAYVTEKGYMNGVDVDLFAPLEGTTRAMVVTVLYRMETEPAEVEAAGFPDLDPVNGFWYVDAVNWATANQIARGYEDGTFRPSNIVTREELATFFYRWAQYKNYNVSLVADLSGYADNGDIQDYAKEAMAWAVAVGLIQGVTENTLCPVTYAKRAETAMMLYRLTGDPKVVAAITSTEDLDDPDTPMAETPDTPYVPPYNPHTHSYTYGDWTPTEDGTQHTRTGTCSCGQTNVEIADHTYTDGVCTTCGAITAPGVTAKAVEALNAELAKITGNNNQPLVTAVLTDNKLSMTLDTDAIKGSGASFEDDLLNGLMTKIKTALDETFGNYKLSVNNNEVYAGGTFNNTALKAAIYDVAGGFFYTLANMEPTGDIYTYKTVKANVDNVAGNADKYAFDLAIQLKGADVEKVQEMADILEKHLAMDKMSKEEAAQYGITGENEYILVKMEMPDAIMNTLKGMLADQETGEIDAEALAELTNMFNNNAEVVNILGLMAALDMDSMIGSGQTEVATLINMVNGNKNLVNKVLSKLTFKVQTIADVEGKEAYSGLLIKENATFNPLTNDWAGLVNAIVEMLDENGGNVVPGQFAIADRPDYYLVPITVTIDLENSMDFKATETVLFELHIPLSELGPAVEPEIPAKTKTELAKEALANALNAMVVTHGDADLVAVEDTTTGFAVTLNTDAIMGEGSSFAPGALDGLMTKLKDGLDENFAGYSLSVNGKEVYDNEVFNNTELKAAIYDVAGGFFYNLSKLEQNNGLYKTLNAVVAGEGDDKFEFTLDIKLAGDDMDKVIEMATILADHLAMSKMSSAEAAQYGIYGEDEFILVKMEMPSAIMNTLKGMLTGEENGEIDAETLAALTDVFNNNAEVVNILSLMANLELGDMIGSGQTNVATLISMVNGNKELVNKVLSKLTFRVQTIADVESKEAYNGLLIKENATFNPLTNDWAGLVNAIVEMLDDNGGNVVPGQFATGTPDYYLVPITVTIDLDSSMGFEATETVLFELHIPLSTLGN